MALLCSMNNQCLVYCIVGKFAGRKFGEFLTSVIHQIKNIQLIISNLLVDLFICQTFLPSVQKGKFTKQYS